MPFTLEINGFLEEGKVKPELISDIGQNNVKELAEFLTRKVEDRYDKSITTNQLRKFYDSFLKIYITEQDDSAKKIQLLLLKAQVEYAEKRLYIKRFGKFMRNRVEVLLKAENFKLNLDAFKIHFESLIAYFPKN